MAAGLLWILDASINLSMEPFRAFVADKLPEEQRSTGFSMQSLFIGLGAVIASGLPWMMTNWFHVTETAWRPTPFRSRSATPSIGGGSTLRRCALDGADFEGIPAGRREILPPVKIARPRDWRHRRGNHRRAQRNALDHETARIRPALAKRGRHLYLVGETFKDRSGINSFVGPNMLDGQFDFPLYDSIKDCFAEEKAGLDRFGGVARRFGGVLW